MNRMPLRVRFYIGACAVIAVGVAVATVISGDGFWWQAAIGFGVLCFLAENFNITTAAGTTYSVGFVLTIAAIVAAGPAEAIFATLCSAVTLRDFRARPPMRHLFNAAQLAIATGLSG
ncbi:MAG TPA: hypothetical protein VM600_09545, partial [Actinomycetota bacterium]|nr:hypothetical protein [Actinomycetota bacterium]